MGVCEVGIDVGVCGGDRCGCVCVVGIDVGVCGGN